MLSERGPASPDGRRGQGLCLEGGGRETRSKQNAPNVNVAAVVVVVAVAVRIAVRIAIAIGIVIRRSHYCY